MLNREMVVEGIKIVKPTLLVLSGPSGTGKTTIRDNILSTISGSTFSISATTRAKRPHEKDEKDYFFISKDRFEELIREGRFVEWEKVHGNYYGTPLKPVERAQQSNMLMIFDIDVYGGQKVKEKFPEAILVYLKVKSKDILKERLTKRNTDSPEQIEKRLERMEKEDGFSEAYDHVIVNDNLDETLRAIYQIISEFQKD